MQDQRDENNKNFGDVTIDTILDADFDEDVETKNIREKMDVYNNNKDSNSGDQDLESEDLEVTRRKIVIRKKKLWCLIVDDNTFNLMVANHIMQQKKL